jgi:hypothetical protein
LRPWIVLSVFAVCSFAPTKPHLRVPSKSRTTHSHHSAGGARVMSFPRSFEISSIPTGSVKEFKSTRARTDLFFVLRSSAYRHYFCSLDPQQMAMVGSAVNALLLDTAAVKTAFDDWTQVLFGWVFLFLSSFSSMSFVTSAMVIQDQNISNYLLSTLPYYSSEENYARSAV